MLKYVVTALVLLCGTVPTIAPAFAQDGLEGAISFRNRFPDPSLTGPPIHFTAKLSADEESSVVESPGAGEMSFVLDRRAMKLSWKMTFTGLTSPAVSAGIHGPGTPGVNSGVLFDLAPKGLKRGTKGVTEGSVTLTDGELSYLLMDRMYVNIMTEKFKEGEIRGEIERIRSGPAAPVASR